MDDYLIVCISKLARIFRSQYLHQMKSSAEKIRENWWEAFRFASARFLLRGRSIISSSRIQYMIEEAIREHLDVTSESLSSISMHELENVRNLFSQMSIEGRTYKRKIDIEMLFGSKKKDSSKKAGLLHFISKLPESNIVKHSLKQIESGKIGSHYNELISLWGIGKTAAAIYLRDLIDLYFDTIGKLVRTPDVLAYALPIDSCVQKVAKDAGLDLGSSSQLRQAEALAEACRQITISHRLAINFTQGASWLCNSSVDASLEFLKRCNLSDKDLEVIEKRLEKSYIPDETNE